MNERVILARLQRLAVRLDAGPRAGAFLFRSRQRFAGRAEPMGLHFRGRLRDYHFVLSALRERQTYRRKETSPQRAFTAVLDARWSGDRGAAGRLWEAAGLVCGVLLGMAGSVVSLTAFGTARPVPPTPFAGVGDWFALQRVLTAWGRIAPGPSAAVGALRQACQADESNHVVLISHYLPPAWLPSLGLAGRCTLVLVEPPGGAAVGLEDPGLSLGPAVGLALRVEDRYEELCRDAARAKLDVHVLRADLPPLDALEGLLGGRRPAPS
jgi:hypothetical protein